MNIETFLRRNRQTDAQATSPPAVVRMPSAIEPIREIGPRYREPIARHLRALDASDRYLRFGYAANDSQIRQYVERLNFERDCVFGIFNRKLELVAMAHLAYDDHRGAAGTAEFGVSVARHARGRGYGTRLFERAAIHAVNAGVQTLFIHALSENTAMLRIARGAGAKVERCGSESEAHLQLPEASFRSRFSQMLSERVGKVDYLLKAEATRVRGLLTARDVNAS
jgi:RimJ/RimL family protein N-acetyltransferase